MLKIIRIPALKDNYIWLLVNPHSHSALVVDPGEALPVLNILREENLTLLGILITHHHWDHTAGVLELVEKTNAAVYGGASEPIAGLTNSLREGDTVYFKELDLSLQIFDIPGHTLGHIAYYCENHNHDCENHYDGFVFTGDTLFTGGCGRLFEGTAEQMFSSLTKLKKLPLNTQIYCGHEYTSSNLRFASSVEPQNMDVIGRLKEVERLRAQHLATVPAPLSIELKTNPFLRTEQPNVIKSIEQHSKTTFESKSQIFLAIRQWKDQF
jgi:hydroxyacylglutathione hydrolase